MSLFCRNKYSGARRHDVRDLLSRVTVETIFKKIILFTDLFLAVLGLCLCRLSLVVENRGASLAVACGLFIAVVSPAVGHGL